MYKAILEKNKFIHNKHFKNWATIYQIGPSSFQNSNRAKPEVKLEDVCFALASEIDYFKFSQGDTINPILWVKGVYQSDKDWSNTILRMTSSAVMTGDWRIKKVSRYRYLYSKIEVEKHNG